MAYEIGFVDNTGSEGLAHWQMLAKIKQLAEANGWTTLRYTTPTDGSNRELILKGAGLSGTEEIYIGFRTYHLATADYYNLTVAGFVGYVAGNTFSTQPGYIERAVCAHNQRIDYWLAVNGQRVLLGMKIGSPAVYEVAYVGKVFPYATPGQYPYPLAVCGTLPAATPATRYSDTSSSHHSGVRGSLTSASSAPNESCGVIRTLDGSWQAFFCAPWTQDLNNQSTTTRDTGGYYTAIAGKILLGGWPNATGNLNALGEFDGVRYITGFNNLSENTAMIGGKTNVVLGDVWRTGLGDYFLLEMT